jgi:hypothetical protein
MDKKMVLRGMAIAFVSLVFILFCFAIKLIVDVKKNSGIEVVNVSMIPLFSNHIGQQYRTKIDLIVFEEQNSLFKGKLLSEPDGFIAPKLNEVLRFTKFPTIWGAGEIIHGVLPAGSVFVLVKAEKITTWKGGVYFHHPPYYYAKVLSGGKFRDVSVLLPWLSNCYRNLKTKPCNPVDLDMEIVEKTGSR